MAEAQVRHGRERWDGARRAPFADGEPTHRLAPAGGTSDATVRARGDRSRVRPDVAAPRAEGLALPLDSGKVGGGDVLEEAAAMLGTA